MVVTPTPVFYINKIDYEMYFSVKQGHNVLNLIFIYSDNKVASRSAHNSVY